eukprot:SAG31_NODE_26298_length_444_cov_4.640580_1_plen_52_part_10
MGTQLHRSFSHIFPPSPAFINKKKKIQQGGAGEGTMSGWYPWGRFYQQCSSG